MYAPDLPILAPSGTDCGIWRCSHNDSLEIENQPNAIRRGISDFFDANAEPCTCRRDKDGNVIPNPNIKRASLSKGVSPSSPLAPKFVKNSYGNYNVEELAKIAVDQQMRAEKRRKRKMRWIRRGIVFCIIISLILTNWDMFYFACKTFIISKLVFSSRFPVGSSQINILGPFTIARAIATLCCSPPDN